MFTLKEITLGLTKWIFTTLIFSVIGIHFTLSQLTASQKSRLFTLIKDLNCASDGIADDSLALRRKLIFSEAMAIARDLSSDERLCWLPIIRLFGTPADFTLSPAEYLVLTSEMRKYGYFEMAEA